MGSGRLFAWGILYFEAETLVSETRSSGLFLSASSIKWFKFRGSSAETHSA
jgi:hypothetical protein